MVFYYFFRRLFSRRDVFIYGSCVAHDSHIGIGRIIQSDEWVYYYLLLFCLQIVSRISIALGYLCDE